VEGQITPKDGDYENFKAAEEEITRARRNSETKLQLKFNSFLHIRATERQTQRAYYIKTQLVVPMHIENGEKGISVETSRNFRRV